MHLANSARRPQLISSHPVSWLLMDTSPTPPHFKPSAKNAPDFRDATARVTRAAAFAAGAQLYDDVRPTYPTEVTALVDDAPVVVDIGAGTGKLTEGLIRPGRAVYALDPSADMVHALRRRCPSVRAWRATAEATGLRTGSVDAAVYAQAWHWVDKASASAEADRIIAPGGHLMLCWNTLDVTHPWVLRLSRISHSGDVHREGFTPDVDKPWHLVRELRTTWFQAVTTDDLFALAQTRSYWLRADDDTRARVMANLHWYVFDRLGFDEDQPIPLPYRTDAFLYSR